jgi:hypothetical protein
MPVVPHLKYSYAVQSKPCEPSQYVYHQFSIAEYLIGNSGISAFGLNKHIQNWLRQLTEKFVNPCEVSTAKEAVSDNAQNIHKIIKLRLSWLSRTSLF